MKLFKYILKKFSRIIYRLTPQELLPNSFSNPAGVYKLLIENNDRVTYEILGKHFSKCIPLENANLAREFAIGLALSNEKKYNRKDDLFYLEFGTWKGHSANFFSRYVDKFFVFDSFEGLREDWGGMLKKGAFDLNGKIPRLKNNITPVKGWVEDTLDDFLKKYNPKINFVHLDMDLYAPTLFTLEKIKPYLVNGAVILFDEFYNYLDWQEGEYKAFVETFDENEYQYEGYNISGKQVLISIRIPN